jgi:hypothetical protein
MIMQKVVTHMPNNTSTHVIMPQTSPHGSMLSHMQPLYKHAYDDMVGEI